MFLLLALKIEILILIFNRAIDSYLLTDHSCNNLDLTKLGCKCILNSDLNYNSKKSVCLNRLYKLNCVLNINSNTTQNYYDRVIEDLNLMEDCWSQLYIENVHSITNSSLRNLKFSTAKNQNDIFFWFKNVQEIDSLAFNMIQLNNQNNLIIKLDSNYPIQRTSGLILRDKCFSNISKCKKLELTNFFHLETESMRISHFENSHIESLFISYMNFKGFILDADPMLNNISIKYIIIDNCYQKIINLETIGNFVTLNGLQVKNSGVSVISPKVFEYCCKNIKQLYLDNNLLKLIENDALTGISNLAYLNLENNPIEYIEKNALNSFRNHLVKLNLKSANLISINDSFYNMNELRELILTNTRKLNSDNLAVIFRNSPSLEYLKLDDSNLLKTSSNLNVLFDQVENNLDRQHTIENKAYLKYLDMSYNGLDLNETLFEEDFNRNKNCLWSNLLSKTFIKVNSDHPCNCALLYIYRNLTKFEFPILNETFDYESDLMRPFLHDYFRLNLSKTANNEWKWREVLTLLPKCYAQLLLDSFNFEIINFMEVKCGLWEYNLNCSEVRTTTKKIYTTRTTTLLIRNTTNDNFGTKTISSPYTLPIMLILFIFSIVIIILSVLKTKRDFINKFRINNKHTLLGLPEEIPKEMENIQTISFEINNNDNDDDVGKQINK